MMTWQLMSFYFLFVNTKVKTLKNEGKSCPLNFWSLGSEVLDIALIVGLLFCKGDTYHFSLTALLFPMLCGIGFTVPTTELTEGKVHYICIQLVCFGIHCANHLAIPFALKTLTTQTMMMMIIKSICVEHFAAGNKFNVFWNKQSA